MEIFIYHLALFQDIYNNEMYKLIAFHTCIDFVSYLSQNMTCVIISPAESRGYTVFMSMPPPYVLTCVRNTAFELCPSCN